MFRTRPKNAKKATRKAFEELMARKNNNNRRPRNNNSAMQNRSNRNKNINGEVISPGVAKKAVNGILSAYFPKDVAKKATGFGYEIYKLTKNDDVKYWVKIIVLLYLIYIGEPAGLVNKRAFDRMALIRSVREVQPVPASFWGKFPKYLGFTVKEYTPSQLENFFSTRFSPVGRYGALVLKRGIWGDEETSSSLAALLLSLLLYVYIYTGDTEIVKSYAKGIGLLLGQIGLWYAKTELYGWIKLSQVKWGAITTVLTSLLGMPASKLVASRFLGSSEGPPELPLP